MGRHVFRRHGTSDTIKFADCSFPLRGNPRDASGRLRTHTFPRKTDSHDRQPLPLELASAPETLQQQARLGISHQGPDQEVQDQLHTDREFKIGPPMREGADVQGHLRSDESPDDFVQTR